MSGALAIFVRTPGESPVKTRLAAACGERYAVAWYRLAAAAVASVARAAERRYGLRAYWAVTGTPGAWPEFPILAQGQGGLGERMARVHGELVERHELGVLLGADTPQLTAALLREAVDWLRSPSPRLALGPARDGGFWLFGANRVPPVERWTAIRYSAADTGRELQQAMQDLGDWRTLETLRDADHAADLAGVQQALENLRDPTPEQRELARWMAEQDVAGTRSPA